MASQRFHKKTMVKELREFMRCDASMRQIKDIRRNGVKANPPDSVTVAATPACVLETEMDLRGAFAAMSRATGEPPRAVQMVEVHEFCRMLRTAVRMWESSEQQKKPLPLGVAAKNLLAK
jgi:hypothetical protein